ncbi:MAG: carbohydrate ABC transporter permease [Jatrophihabitans sp.]
MTATTQVTTGSAAPSPETPPRPARGRGDWVQRITGGAHPALFLFTVPALALTIIFFLIPTLEGFRFAVTDWNGYSAAYSNVGAGNFTRILSNGDDLFRNALFNNVKLMIFVVIAQTALSLMFAILLVRNSKSSIALRALFFFPTILASVSVAFAWRFMYDPNYGLINDALGHVGLSSLKSSFLGSSTFGILFVGITQVWAHTGQVMVIYIAGLQQIPDELYEAATVDGATRWQKFKSVTWPMAAPATAIVIAYTTIQSFKAFDLILGLSGNPPQSNVDILSTRIYAGFANSKFGYAAAESILFMALIIAVTLVQRRAARLTQAQA